MNQDIEGTENSNDDAEGHLRLGHDTDTGAESGADFRAARLGPDFRAAQQSDDPDDAEGHVYVTTKDAVEGGSASSKP